MPDLIALYGWPMLLAMAAAAVVIGFSKTSFGGIAALSVAVFALARPRSRPRPSCCCSSSGT